MASAGPRSAIPGQDRGRRLCRPDQPPPVAGASRRRRPSPSRSSTRTTTSSSSTSRPASWSIPAAGHGTGTLVNALIAHCGASLSGIGGVTGRASSIGSTRTRPASSSWPRTISPIRASPRNSPITAARAPWSAPTRPWSGACRTVAIGRSPPPSPAAPITGRRSPSCEGSGRAAITHYTVMRWTCREAHRWRASCAARWKPAAPTRSGCTWPISAIRSWATGFTGRASRPRPAGSQPGSRRPCEALGRQALHAAILGFEHPGRKKPCVSRAMSRPTWRRFFKALRKP